MNIVENEAIRQCINISKMNNITIGESELEQVKRFSIQRASSLEQSHDTIFGLNKELDEAHAKIERLKSEIFRLKRMDHCCGSCGNVIHPSHYADGL